MVWKNGPLAIAQGFTGPYSRATLSSRTAILAPGGWALTENLPNVFAFCLLRTEALRENSSSRGKESRLSSRQRPWFVSSALMVCAEAFMASAFCNSQNARRKPGDGCSAEFHWSWHREAVGYD